MAVIWKYSYYYVNLLEKVYLVVFPNSTGHCSDGVYIYLDFFK